MLKVIFLPFVIFLILFSCLFYASVTILPVAIIQTVIAVLILVWILEMLFKAEFSFVKMPFVLSIILFLGLIVFQLLPLPLILIRLFSGNTAWLYEKFMPLAGLRAFLHLSIYPNATLAALFKVLTYIGIFFLVVNNLETKKEFDLVINTIIFFGVAISLFGVIQKYAFPNRVYWFDAPSSAGSPFGPFVNRNNFAGYINMIIPLALTYALVNMPLAKRVIYGFCAGIMSLALFLSLSRAGVIVFVSVLAFLLLFSRFKESLKTQTKIFGIGLLTILVLFVLLMDSKIVWDRLSTLFQKDTFIVFGHGYSWWDILRIWQDFPLFGTGFGTFASISPMYKTTGAQSIFSYAHNDYLQLLAETGLIGFIAATSFFVIYFYTVIRLWLQRHDPYVCRLSLGCMAAIFGMLVYSLLDFNLQIPANALLFFIILGLVFRLNISRFKDAVSG